MELKLEGTEPSSVYGEWLVSMRRASTNKAAILKIKSHLKKASDASGIEVDDYLYATPRHLGFTFDHPEKKSLYVVCSPIKREQQVDIELISAKLESPYECLEPSLGIFWLGSVHENAPQFSFRYI